MFHRKGRQLESFECQKTPCRVDEQGTAECRGTGQYRTLPEARDGACFPGYILIL